MRSGAEDGRACILLSKTHENGCGVTPYWGRSLALPSHGPGTSDWILGIGDCWERVSGTISIAGRWARLRVWATKFNNAPRICGWSPWPAQLISMLI